MTRVTGALLRLACLFVAAALLPPLAGCQDPPASRLQTAKLALDTAQRSGATRHAETPYRAAESLLRTALREVGRQKGRLAPLRDYAVAETLLSHTIVLANRASRDALARTRSLERLANADMATLASELSNYRRSLDSVLTHYQAERSYSRGAMALQTARRLFTQGEYAAARAEAVAGRRHLRQLAQALAERDNEEAPYLQTWRRWVDDTVAESRRTGGKAVVVDKSDHRAYLLQAGRIVRTYTAEFGFNPARQKMHAGDGATPEGRYRVTHELTRSRYYKALRIDYPNAEDRRRYNEARRRGQIRGSIGGLIEIHGEGGQGENWTMGCVALSNADMDHLMREVGVGTPVTIVRRAENWP